MLEEDSRSTHCPNGVQVETRIVGGTMIVVARWKKKILNRYVAPTFYDAGRTHRLYVDTWSVASEDNLTDESQDAPLEDASTWTVKGEKSDRDRR